MTLGQKIRAGRLRWYAAPRHGCMVRVEDLPGNRWRIELSPIDKLVPSKGSSGLYRELHGHADGMLDITELGQVRMVKRYFAVTVNDAGIIIHQDTQP